MNSTRHNFNRRTPRTRRSRRGLTIFIVCTAVAVGLGLSIRNYFSSDRLRTWIDAALAKQSKSVEVKYEDIGVRLASGSLPQFAIELSKVEVRQMPECRSEPAFRASRLRFPLRIGALLTGKIAFGLIRAEDLEIDLDSLRPECGERAPVANTGALLPAPSPLKTAAGKSAEAYWWHSDQFFHLRETLEGLEFLRARVQFEKKTKSVYLDKFRVALDPNDLAFIVNGRIHVPRELTEGEQIPDLEMTAVVREAEARVRTEARLNEGRIGGEARLVPTSDHDLRIESRIQVSSLPLSTAVPLVSKVAMIKRPMRPKFLWLNCQAEIAGKFHGLFSENPLELKNCEMSGKGTSIQIAKATRRSTGDWEPFSAVVRSADVRQLLETFSIEGLDGIATDFGRLDGVINVEGKSLSLDGQLDGMQLRFSNRNHRALQTVRNVQTKIAVDAAGGVNGRISQMEVEGGEFAGDIQFQFTKSAGSGRVDLNLSKLRLANQVETLMTGGETQGLSGRLVAGFADGRIANLDGNLKFHGFRSADWQIEDLTITPSLGSDHDVRLKLRAAAASLLPASALHAASQEFLFNQYSASEPLVFRDVSFDGEVPAAGGFRWSELKAITLTGRLRLLSHGQWTRDDRTLTGELRADYPAIKKLSWALGGTLDQPSFTFDEGSASTAFVERVKTDSITDRDLGLPAKN